MQLEMDKKCHTLAKNRTILLLTKLLWYKSNKTLRYTLQFQKKNELWRNKSPSASSHRPVLDYFPITAQHRVFYFLLISCYKVS